MGNCGKTYQVEYGTEEPCNPTSTECVVETDPLIYLGLPANATQKEINNALMAALQAANNTIQYLQNITSYNKNKNDITIDGAPFLYRPIRGNDTLTFKAGDAAFMGWYDQNTIGKILIYKGVEGKDINEDTPITDWNLIEQLP